MKAKAIIAYRQQNGPFKSVDDLKKVPGLGDKLLAQLKDQSPSANKDHAWITATVQVVLRHVGDLDFSPASRDLVRLVTPHRRMRLKRFQAVAQQAYLCPQHDQLPEHPDPHPPQGSAPRAMLTLQAI